MRLGEILGLRWGQVDFRKRTICVERTKSGKRRFIPINATLLELLRSLRLDRPVGETVFANPKTGQALVAVRTAFKAACRRAKLSGLRFHDLRHTFATRLIEAGADIITVKELLGHFSVQMTERYTHSRSEQKVRAVELLAAERPEIAMELSRPGHAENLKKPVPPLSGVFSVN
jgi:integrase